MEADTAGCQGRSAAAHGSAAAGFFAGKQERVKGAKSGWEIHSHEWAWAKLSAFNCENYRMFARGACFTRCIE